MTPNGFDDALGTLSFFRRYACNLTASAFPVLTANRRAGRTTEREIVLLGDSHSWGQGSPDFDGLHIYSPHMAVPYNKGYYARLSRHVEQKLEMTQAAVLPFSAEALLQGRYQEGRYEISGPLEATGFYSHEANRGKAFEHLGYLAEDGKFGHGVFVLGLPESGEKSEEPCCSLTMDAHARKLFIAIAAGPHGAKLEIKLRTPPYYVKPPDFPKVYRVSASQLLETVWPEAETTAPDSVIIDTYSETISEYVYCIDYGTKQKGAVLLRYAGAHEAADASGLGGLTLAGPSVLIRGIVYDGNRIRNFAMGGHTVGQWLGDGTLSFHNEAYPHIDELLDYVPFTPTLAVIQAPVVNEYLRQTELSSFTHHLSLLIGKLNGHLNPSGSRKMDVLVFTTPGDQNILYRGAASLPNTYSSYYEAVHRFCLNSACGFIDFQRYFADAVEAGLDHELLYDDAIHPSPFVNEFIAKGLTGAFDLLW